MNRIKVFKDAMSRVASQAMVLTAGSKGYTESQLLHGMTLSSVSSLTVNPEPIIQFNLQVPSATATALHESKHLALNILRPCAQSVDIAHKFSQGIKFINAGIEGKEHATTPFCHLSKDQWEMYTGIEGLQIPILTQQSERVLICQKLKVFKVYNHEIWTCTVEDIINTGSVNDPEDPKSGGLVYFDRNFHKIGDTID